MKERKRKAGRNTLLGRKSAKCVCVGQREGKAGTMQVGHRCGRGTMPQCKYNGHMEGGGHGKFGG